MICADELRILELVAWDIDTGLCVDEWGERSSSPVILRAETERQAHLFENLHQREDLQQEFAGLSWSIAIVDLRTLQAFQRRLVFDPIHSTAPAPCGDDWIALTALAFGPLRSTAHTYLDAVTIQSENPDLHLRATAMGWELHGGSPFFEVALYKGRAFLRDGYHRAFTLLSAGIHAIPAIVIEARSMDQVCFDSPNFFSESILFGPRPPMVTDFLNPSLTITDATPRILKTIYIPTEINVSFLEPTKEYHP